MMNERIRELYRQAHTDGFFGMAFDPEKFAQLIVRECAEVGDSGDPLQDGGIARMIKQHFGIE